MNMDISSKTIKQLAKRKLGKTGRKVSIIGLGGCTYMYATQKVADKLVQNSIACGVDYFDVAPSYHEAELRLGPALKPYRDKVFLACKSTKRDRDGIQKEMEASFERLKTDHFELYQLHAINEVEKDVNASFAKGGAMEAILKAREQGKIKYIRIYRSLAGSGDSSHEGISI